MIHTALAVKNALRPFTPPVVAQSWRRFRGRDRLPVEEDQKHLSSALPTRELSHIFPSIEKVVVNLSVMDFKRESGMLPLEELVTLAAICKYLEPRHILEIGTFKGSSTLIMAAHTSPDATVFTLDLPLDYATTKFDIQMGNIENTDFLVGECFRDTEYVGKIRQLYGDSAVFDFSPYFGSIGLVFVDGNHAYENVMADTETAFRLISPTGVIIWDDYHPIFGPGVMQALGEVSDNNIFQIAGTRFAIYRNHH